MRPEGPRGSKNSSRGSNNSCSYCCHVRKAVGGLGNVAVWVGEAGEPQQLFGVFTHPGLDVVAGYIVPFDTIIVEIVEDGDASLIIAGLAELPVVWLGTVGTSGTGPVTVPRTVGCFGRGDTSRGTGPEPSVHDGRLQVFSVAAIEVTFASRCPDVLNAVAAHAIVHEVGLILGLEAHQILTMLPADVTSVEPVPLVRCCRSVGPGEEVVVTVPEGGRVLDTVGTGDRVWPDEFPLGQHHTRQHSQQQHTHSQHPSESRLQHNEPVTSSNTHV